VVRTIGMHGYELDIPATIQKHRTFPVSLLHAAADDPLPGQVVPPPLPVIVEGEEEWEVEEILDSRRTRGWLQYLVKWRGFTDPTWEPEENLTGVEVVDIYHGHYPERHPYKLPSWELGPKRGLLSRRVPATRPRPLTPGMRMDCGVIPNGRWISLKGAVAHFFLSFFPFLPHATTCLPCPPLTTY